MPLWEKATAKEKRLMTSNENHILRIISPLETQSHRDSATSAEKKLDFMFLYTSDRPFMNLRSGHPTCSTWRMVICFGSYSS